MFKFIYSEFEFYSAYTARRNFELWIPSLTSVQARGHPLNY